MPTLKNSFLQHVSQTSTSPDGFEVSHGKGIYLYDPEGKPFIDCISGITVSSLGHGHPRIMEAIRKQLDLHLHTHVYGEHIIAPQIRLANTLADLLPPSLNNAYFVNSGAEAVEGAIKLAKKYTGRYDIIACKNAYHGSTAAAESLRSDLEYTASGRPLIPGIIHIQFNREEDLKKINDKTAAVIIEPIQGEAGVILPHPGYLAAVKRTCEENGALLIFDEIQTGMGRTGSLWAFEQENVIPDILLLAKAFGGGLPLGAFISKKEIMEVLAKDPPLGHMTTFGGNPLCCAASLEAVRTITSEGLSSNAVLQGKRITDSLNGHPAVNEIRGRGLLLAIDLKNDHHLHPAVQNCRDEGLLIDWFLFNKNSLRLAPPLIISDEETVQLIEKLSRALDRL